MADRRIDESLWPKRLCKIEGYDEPTLSSHVPAHIPLRARRQSVVDLGRWCRSGQTHNLVLGARAPTSSQVKGRIRSPQFRILCHERSNQGVNGHGYCGAIRPRDRPTGGSTKNDAATSRQTTDAGGDARRFRNHGPFVGADGGLAAEGRGGRVRRPRGRRGRGCRGVGARVPRGG
jgi:hypothetical protein